MRTLHFLMLTVCVVAVGMYFWACSPSTSNGGCSSGELSCGGKCCPNDTQYACSSGNCVLTSCNEGLYLCGPGCITIGEACCDQSTGKYCNLGYTCCGTGCMTLGYVCCGTYNCPNNQVCCNGNECCP